MEHDHLIRYREQLQALWKSFRKLRGPRVRRATSLYGAAMSRFLQSSECGAWRELVVRSFPNPRTRPSFYLVRYPGPVVMPTEGFGILLGTRDWDGSPAEVADFLASAVQGLGDARESE